MENEVQENKFRGFFGNYQHSLDAKGRVFVPAKFREGLGNSFMLIKGLDHCLVAYSFSEWDKLTKSLEFIPFTDEDARDFKRTLFETAIECDLDKQGRILINADLRDDAGLTKDVRFIGNMNYVEVWDDEEWKSKRSKRDDTSTRAEKMQKYLYKGENQ